MRRTVVVESPYMGEGSTEEEIVANTARNIRYLRACLRDCVVNYNESPYASHAILTQPGVLDDNNPEERALGIAAGFELRHIVEATVVYTDLGISRGMRYGIEDAEAKNRPYEYRTLGPDWEEKALESEKKRPGLGW